MIAGVFLHKISLLVTAWACFPSKAFLQKHLRCTTRVLSPNSLIVFAEEVIVRGVRHEFLLAHIGCTGAPINGSCSASCVQALNVGRLGHETAARGALL